MFKNVFMFGHCTVCRRRWSDLASLNLGASVVSVDEMLNKMLTNTQLSSLKCLQPGMLVSEEGKR